jgi:hypothetical protein
MPLRAASSARPSSANARGSSPVDIPGKLVEDYNQRQRAARRFFPAAEPSPRSLFEVAAEFCPYIIVRLLVLFPPSRDHIILRLFTLFQIAEPVLENRIPAHFIRVFSLFHEL